MKRGTTPTHRFVLPFSVDMIEEVEITYKQNEKEILKRYKNNCDLDDNVVSTTLSQEDTFDFQEGVNVSIQIRVLTVDGTVCNSNIFCVSCEKCLSDEVL